ncbi:RNA polymerase sigma-70 factor [Deminuibacter soli]|uniref:RNA polymerase sigma-70 factor n=1 Tax=Deminuibacter soli TaxID=2291815 RepID=UPI001314B5F2|nr:RNA polymerase sigma-70 factor [Deminuibacter soli]
MKENGYKEKELLTQTSTGCETAFRELFVLYRNKVYSFAMQLTHHTAVAEEITQDVFLKLWQSRLQLREVTHFNAYLRVVVRNTAYTYLKKMASEKLALAAMPPTVLPLTDCITEQQVVFNECHGMLQQAIAQLPGQQKKVYLLSREDGMAYTEIASSMALSVNTVKDYMKQALQFIRRYMHTRLGMWLLCFLLWLQA